MRPAEVVLFLARPSGQTFNFFLSFLLFILFPKQKHGPNLTSAAPSHLHPRSPLPSPKNRGRRLKPFTARGAAARCSSPRLHGMHRLDCLHHLVQRFAARGGPKTWNCRSPRVRETPPSDSQRRTWGDWGMDSLEEGAFPTPTPQRDCLGSLSEARGSSSDFQTCRCGKNMQCNIPPRTSGGWTPRITPNRAAVIILCHPKAGGHCSASFAPLKFRTFLQSGAANSSPFFSTIFQVG